MQSFIVRWYAGPALSEARTRKLLEKLRRIHPHVHNLETEWCYHVEVRRSKEDIACGLTEEERRVLGWLLRARENESALCPASDGDALIECGPRFNFSSPQSTNAVSVCHSAGVGDVARLERSTRYLIGCGSGDEALPDAATRDLFVAALHDRMTECEYTAENAPRRSFDEALPAGGLRTGVRHVDILGEGSAALERLDAELGLGFDAADLAYYTRLFRDLVCRNPTDVECFDLAQSNSEHSRHWFFKGRLVVDGRELPCSLIDMIIDTQLHSNDNNVIKFSDNSSSVRGWRGARVLRPTAPGRAGELAPTSRLDLDIIFTAETHNFPTGMAPFAGATTGTGGRIRDVQAVGRGGEPLAGTAGYCTADLHVPGYVQPWERTGMCAASRFAAPLDVLLRASDGASDYGNKFGEPVVCGFARTYSGEPHGEGAPPRAWLKPVMFSGGLGVMDAQHAAKRAPQPGMLVCKIGGPAYRIGVGGGAASSAAVQGGGGDDDADSRAEHLDWNAVQRGDAEMGQKLNRAVRACVEMGADNPIASIHDQGAGGNGNVLKELLEPLGGVIRASSFELGDPTLTPLELWAAEYQESNALLCEPGEPLEALRRACQRERCPLSVVGEVGDNGRVSFAVDGLAEPPYDLRLEHVLGEGAAPRKTFRLDRLPAAKSRACAAARLAAVAPHDALERVLRLPAVASKRYLCNKVDRSVTGLVAQQQCVGPLHVPVADCAVVAVSHFERRGAATSLGEQPLKLLEDAAAGARMTVAEALQNLAFCRVSARRDIKCSGNWMWAAKAAGEGARLADACAAMCAVMAELGVAVDGGKDSLGMAARTDSGELVVAPPQLVVSCYAPCPDVRARVTPAVRSPALGRRGVLVHIDCGGTGSDACRLGGSALAQCYGAVGLPCPDLEKPRAFAAAWDLTQRLVDEGCALSGHDVSDGGLIVCLLEMAFAGACGLDVRVHAPTGDALAALFAEEAGWVLELQDDAEAVEATMSEFTAAGVSARLVGRAIGYGLREARVVVRTDADATPCIDAPLLDLMLAWEETSFRLEMLQADEACARAEWNAWRERTHAEPRYSLSFDPAAMSVQVPRASLPDDRAPLVCVLREEGSNGDRELAAAFSRAGFRVWDATMADLASGAVSTAHFRGLAFPGGFSYADVLGSARGWAAACTYNETARRQLQHFLRRPDTFSLGVCNGCQLLALLPGWLTADGGRAVSLERNASERFECRWGAVRVEPGSRSLMFGGGHGARVDWPRRTDMRGSTLGVWSAHGEGRFAYEDGATLGELERAGCVALRYADDEGTPTERYPYNPNGSAGGVAALCSPDGRHLVMMPHPERADLMYQWPWTPPHWPEYEHSPWHAMFLNAYHWCVAAT